MRTRSFTLPDGASTVAEWFGDDAAPGAGLVVFLPALGVNAEYYRGFAQAWAERGCRVAVIEMRGMKQSSVRDVKRHNFGFREVLNVDLPALAARLAAEVGDAPVYLAGHSLGGQFALLHASRASHRVDGVILVASGSNHFATTGSAWTNVKRWFGFRFIRATVRILGFFPGDKLGFGGRQPKNIMLDWSQEGLTGHYRVPGDPTDYNAAVAGFSKPVLIVSLSGDPLVPRSSADALAVKLAQSKVTQVELQTRDHGLKVFSHFRWVRQPAAVLDPIGRWTDAQTPRQTQDAAAAPSSSA
jgi:predicted alpha/beta hydrolase